METTEIVGATEPSRPTVEKQFDDVEQQRDAAQLGMWIFLSTEVLFFGGLFLAYTVYRFVYGHAFVEASRRLDVVLGGTNTAVLLVSLTVAPYVTTVTSVPSRTTFALPNGIMKFGPGYADLLYVCR